METTIKVTHNTVYGINRYYPANKLAEQLTALCSQSTFTEHQLKHLHTIGFTIEIEAPKPPISFK